MLLGAEKAPQKREPPTLPTDPRLLGRLRGGGGGSASGGTGPSGGCGGGGFGGGGGRFGGGGAGGATTGSIRSCPNGVVRHFSGGGGVVSVGGGRYFGGGPCGSLLRQFSGGACKSLGPRRQSSVSGGRQSFGRVRSSGGHASGLIPMPAAVGRGKFLPRQTSATTTRSATVSARAKVRAKRRRETPMATVVHSVKSPILFFPSWRNMLAGVRGETEERRLLNIEGHGEEAPRQSNVSYSQWQQQNSRSNTADHKKKKGKVSSRKRRTSTHVLEDDSVIILKLLYGLVKEYMSYLLAIGFRPIDVAGDRIFRTKLRKGSNKFPYIVMYQCFDAGLVFLSISFSPPYLMLKLHVFRRAFYAAFNAKTGKEAAKRQVDLHKIVSRLKRRCHVHSFTYDFHLRVLNRCLLRDRNVTPLFPSGLRTIEFLGDFIDYYGSRPISSRNCIHEERIQQCLLVDLNNDDLWAHFLLNGEQLGFNQIMRFKKSNTLGTPDPLDCVLVAREDICQELQNVRIVLYVRKVNPKDRICRTFRLLFFNMFIDSADVAPLAEEMEMYEESRKYYRRKARAVKRAMFLEDADRDEDEETFKTMRFDASSPSREPSPEQQQAPRTSSRSPTPSPAAGRRSSPAPEDEPALENVALPNPEPMSGLELGADLESTADVEFRPVPGTTRENHSEAEKESDVDGIGQVGKDDAASRGAYEPSEGTTSIRGAETAIEAVRSTSRVAEASPASGQILFRNSISAPPTLVSPNRDSHSRRRDKSKDKDRNASGKSVSSMRAQDVRRVGSRSPIPESSAFDVRDSDSDTESALGTGSDPDSESTPKWKRTKRGASGILNFGDIELEIRKKFRSFWSRLDADDGLEQAAEAIKSDVVDLLPTSPTATTMPRDYKKRQRTSPDDDGGDDDVDDVDDDDDPPMEDWVDELLHEAKKYERAQSRARDKVTTSAAVVEEPPATKVVDEVDVAVVVADNRRRIETLMRCGVLPMMDDVELDNVAVGTVYGGGRLTEDGLCALESRHQVMNSEPFAELAAMYAAHLLTDVQRPDSPAVLMNSAEPDLPMSTAIVELGDASTTSSVVPTRKDSLLFTMLRDKLTMQRQVAVDEQIRQELPQLGQCNELNFPPYEVDADEAVDRYEFHDFDEHGIDVIALAYGDTYAYAERGVSVPMRIGVRSESSDVYDGVAESSKRRYASGPTWMYGEDGAEPAPRSSSMWLHHGSLEAEVLLMPDGRERAERAMYEAAWLPITTYTAAAAAAAVGGRRPRRTPPPFGVAPTIPLDRAVHVQYSSLRQQSIQRQLERTTSFFRRRMQTMISNAERHCRVDSLWRRARDPPNEDSAKDAVGSAKKGAKRKRYDDPYRAIRCVEKNHMSPKELATLMLLIRLHLVHDYMPRLEHVLKQANCSRLCKFLVLHFGMSRCRFYDLSALHTKYLMVTNTKDENRMFVVACKGVVGPDVFVAIKERAEDLLDFERLAPKKCPTTSSPDSSSESSSSASRTSSDSQSQLQSQSASTVSLGSESDVSSDESTSPPPPPPPPTSPPMNEIDTTYDTVEGFAKLLVGFMWSDVILNPVERRTLALADWSTRIVDVAAIDVDKDHPANKSVRQNSSSGVGCTN